MPDVPSVLPLSCEGALYRLTLRVRGEPTEGPEVTGDTERKPGRRQEWDRAQSRAGAAPRAVVTRSQDVCLGLDTRGRSGADPEGGWGMGAGTPGMPGGPGSWAQCDLPPRGPRIPAPVNPLATLRHRGLTEGPGRHQRIVWGRGFVCMKGPSPLRV